MKEELHGQLIEVKKCSTLKEYELLALSRMTGEDIEDMLTKTELEHYNKLIDG